MTPASQPVVSPGRKGALVDIAVLDDDVDFISYIEDCLNDEGLYLVRAFTHPDDLFQACQEKAPHIVLLDMKMGPFKGEDVLDELQARHPDVCVIIVTGYPSLEGMRATFKKRVFDYLAKPFSLIQLRQTLANAIDAHGLGRTPQEVVREKLGHRIKVLRVERKWSLKDTAGQTGISISQLSSIERGAHMPSIESLLALCRAFDSKPSDLFASIDF